MIKSVLIANRGEIAIRIARTAKRMGIVTYAIRTRKEPEAVYLSSVDFVLDFPETDGKVSEFLDIDRLIYLAREHEIESIHPGYGYLSENAELAERCRENGIIFIGPSPEVIRLMSDKVAAKEIAEHSGVPMLGASKGTVRDINDARETADRLGYPVIIKAVSGGGGRGMRIVRKKSELSQLYKLATAEAQVAFNDPSVFIEKYLESPKHIEFQIVADNHGNVIHLGERECSIQRKHQKLMEEAPSPALDDRLRKKMATAAVALAKAAKYQNLGTVEFLLDSQKRFYFMEMNTRIQVEHPVTEEITGLDLWSCNLILLPGVNYRSVSLKFGLRVGLSNVGLMRRMCRQDLLPVWELSGNCVCRREIISVLKRVLLPVRKLLLFSIRWWLN